MEVCGPSECVLDEEDLGTFLLVTADFILDCDEVAVSVGDLLGIHGATVRGGVPNPHAIRIFRLGKENLARGCVTVRGVVYECAVSGVTGELQYAAHLSDRPGKAMPRTIGVDKHSPASAQSRDAPEAERPACRGPVPIDVVDDF